MGRSSTNAKSMGVNCDFWHSELEYVQYLVEKHYIVGDAAVDAIGAAEERREELIKAQELTYMNGSTSWRKILKNESANGPTRQQAAALMTLGRELVTLTKIFVGVVVLLGCVALLLIIFKI
ncbi:Coatomer subunit gamma-2 [Hordeum vulgare]|nr:Coatomer subunit gamma-2 [Hordeum vulgare]